MHVVEFQCCACRYADGAVERQGHLFQSDFALDEQCAVVAKVAGPGQDCAIVQRRLVAVRRRTIAERTDRSENEP